MKRIIKYWNNRVLPFLSGRWLGLPLVILWSAALPIAAIMDLCVTLKKKADHIRENKYRFWKK
jgi:hypothetical protein